MITFTQEQIAQFDAQEREMFDNLCIRHHAHVHKSDEEKSEEVKRNEEQQAFCKRMLEKHFKKTNDLEHREWVESHFDMREDDRITIIR